MYPTDPLLANGRERAHKRQQCAGEGTLEFTDASDAVVTRMSYTPYGEKVKSASSGPDIFHQKYTGQVDDGEASGLLYYNARYYDPAIGRFISVDSVIPDAGKTQAFNRYMYVVGNPINFNDPSGHVYQIGYIGENTTTNEDGRENDIEFNWFGQEEEITGVASEKKRDSWGGENHPATIFLDRAGIHPTATVHDHFLTCHWGTLSKEEQTRYRILAVIFGGPAGLEFATSPNAGSMLPAFAIGTTIATTNLTIWSINKALEDYEKIIESKTFKKAVDIMKDQIIKAPSLSFTYNKLVNSIAKGMKNKVKKTKFW